MKVHVKYGLYNAAAAIIWTLLLYVTGIDKSDSGRFISLIAILIPITFIFLGMREKRDVEKKGFIEYGEAFKTGTLITLVHSIIYTVFSFLYFNYINPSFIDFQMQKSIERLQEKGMDDAQIERSMSFMKMFMNPTGFTITSFFGALVIGIIISLIVAALVKNPDPENIS